MRKINSKENVGANDPVCPRNKGITLIALVITIIVLLILAIVSINLVMNGGIIGHAESAVKKYEAAQTDEQDKISGVEQYMGEITGENDSEILWAYYNNEEDEERYLIFIGNVQELAIDDNKEVQAYKIIQDGTQLNHKGEEEPAYKLTNQVVTQTMNGCGIELGNSDFIDNSSASIEKLIVSGNVSINMIETYGSNIKNIKFTEGIQTIPDGFAYNLNTVTNIEFPSTLTTIESDAFYKTSIETITIPKSLTTIHGSAFYQVSKLKTVYYEGTQIQWNNIQVIGSSSDCVTLTDGGQNSVFGGAKADAKVICTDGEIPLFPTTE